jgi:iron complex outermembrane receptor protein
MVKARGTGARSSRGGFGRTGVSWIALLAAGMAAPGLAAAQAQAQTDTGTPSSASTNPNASTNTAEDGTNAIIVTGQRKALQSAAQRKKNADTVIDSITANDIGAFPDKSVAEALQRVPGITVSRFAINTDTAHFTTEPSGVLVRGLPQVRSEFNGRDTFSANGGRSLSWGDVPVELLGGVDIYKNQTAELIEGGVAGTVNLRTRLPFDTSGQLIQVGVRANYGDIGKKLTPDANIYYSNRWQTGIGEFGIMGDAAYSQVKTGSEGLQSYRAGIFTGGMIPGSANADSVFGKGAVVIPSSLSYLDDRFDRKRTGIAAAAQWRSNDHKWLATAQYIRSVYKNSMEEHGIGVGLFGFPGNSASTFRFTPGNSCVPPAVAPDSCGNGIPYPAAGTPDFTFDSNGFMDHGTFNSTGLWWGGDAGAALNSDGQPMLHTCTHYSFGWGGFDTPGVGTPANTPTAYCPGGANVHGASFGTNSRIQQNRDMTQEAAFNLKWDPSDALHFNFDGQYVDSNAKFYDAGVSFGSYANPELSGLGSNPRIVSLQPPTNIFLSPGINGGSPYANPDNYTISSLADQIQDNKGHEWAFRADGVWDVPGNSWIDTLKFGARYSDREELVQSSQYNWNNIGNNWSGGCQYLYYNLDAKPGTCVNGGNTTTFKGYPAGFYDVEKFGEPFFGPSLGSFPFMPFDFLNSHGLDLFASENLGSTKDASGNVVGRIGTGFEPSCNRLGQPEMNPGTSVVLPGSCFAPNEIANISEKTRAAYLMFKFGGHDNIHIGSVKVSGNIGVRYVQTEDSSKGYWVYASYRSSMDPSQVCPPVPLVPGGLTGIGTGTGQPGQVAFPAICFLTPDDQKFANGPTSATPVSSTNKLHHWLPSFNLRFDFSPEWLLRFAASKALSRPDIGLLKNYLKIDLVLPGNNVSDPGWLKDAQGNVIGVQPQYTGSATNPGLKPATAWQFDLSLEHYFGNAGMFSLDLFYKTFQDYIQSGLFVTNITNNGVTRPVQISGPANGKGAKIEGIEVAYNRFFDFLPKPFDGLGMQTNFTYLKNKGVPNANLSTFFPIAGGFYVPALNAGSLEGLSKYSFNLVGLYEKPNFPISLRVAYNWRSKYVITTSDCCVGLPVWNSAAGYLDASIHYNINKNLDLSLEGSNVLNTQTKTLQQLTDETSPEKKIILMPNSWFRQDRRFTIGLRWKLGR